MFSTPATPAGFFPPNHMSDETDNSPNPSAETAPPVRRISNPRPKKVAKKAAKKAAPAEAADPVVAEVFDAPVPERENHSDVPSHAGTDWPEPEAESAGGSPSQTDSAKRKRRRRKGKGGQAAGPPNGGGPSNDEDHSPAAAELKSSEQPQDHRPRPQPQQPRLKIDPELLTKMAWKIYLAEVSEEGVALIGDNDAKDLSRRCFRLAEIFIEEQSRRR